ncbi:MAG: hypothetical protein GY913_14860 [Proteobacteria bacterium]|nr:hypothetical protein [Pseudomonadota bacterium]MCP4918191.1 hypothetical protein [Pseudomonadota bacterium]
MATSTSPVSKRDSRSAVPWVSTAGRRRRDHAVLEPRDPDDVAELDPRDLGQILVQQHEPVLVGRDRDAGLDQRDLLDLQGLERRRAHHLG